MAARALASRHGVAPRGNLLGSTEAPQPPRPEARGGTSEAAKPHPAPHGARCGERHPRATRSLSG
jgi:hypothetical protein